MKNLTFVEYISTLDMLKGCIILAEYLWNPDSEDTPFWDFCYTLLNDIYEDYRKEYNATETLLNGIQDIVYVSNVIERQAIRQGEKEREERQANSFILE